MEQFLNKLYSYEYFGTYLMISIVVLILLFIIILFFGKKDQRKREIEETKKLQQINNPDDAFKEDTVENKVEVTSPIETLSQDNELENTIAVPNLESINEKVETNEQVISEVPEVNVNQVIENNNEPIDSLNDVMIENIDNSNLNLNNENNNLGINLTETKPILEKEEEKPIVFDAFEPINNAPEVPEFNFDEIIKDVDEVKNDPIEMIKPEEETFKSPEVFSSVFVDEKETLNTKENNDEELEFELPTLKKEAPEEKIDMPSLSDLQGETYNIKN